MQADNYTNACKGWKKKTVHTVENTNLAMSSPISGVILKLRRLVLRISNVDELLER